MNMLTKTTALAVSILALSGAACADPDVQLPSFDQVDKNKDGVIEKKEASIIKGFDFKAADTNNDGKISQEEYQVVMPKSGQEGGGMGGGSAP